MRRLRRKLERDPDHPVYLKTLRGVGYRLDRQSA
jgi:DNA-binding response OmpR family regulator